MKRLFLHTCGMCQPSRLILASRSHFQQSFFLALQILNLCARTACRLANTVSSVSGHDLCHALVMCMRQIQYIRYLISMHPFMYNTVSIVVCIVSHGIRVNQIVIYWLSSSRNLFHFHTEQISGLAAWCDPASPLLATVRIALKYPGTQNRFFLSEFKYNLKRQTQHVQRILNWEKKPSCLFCWLRQHQ